MFSRDKPYSFHIELTDKCNAGCPMCPRTAHLDRCRADRSVVQNVELTLADFRRHFTESFCARVDEVILGGAYGDPLAASECLEICEHLTTRGVRLAVSTNGSLRKPDWWQRLGRAMRRTGSRLELHIDGLADTNHLYRVNTSFPKIIENAAAYLATGATAEWIMILFRHNQHQVHEARAMAERMGFARFLLIDTVRFDASGRFRYQMPDGSLRHLEAPTVRSTDFTEPVPAPEREARAGPPRIDCKSARRNSPYISAHGAVSACCWVAGSAEETAFFRGHGHEIARWNIRRRPLEEIMLDEPFASQYAAAWEADRLATCRLKCGLGKRNRRTALAPAVAAE